MLARDIGLAALKGLDDLGGVSMASLNDEELRRFVVLLDHWSYRVNDELRQRNAEKIATMKFD